MTNRKELEVRTRSILNETNLEKLALLIKELRNDPKFDFSNIVTVVATIRYYSFSDEQSAEKVIQCVIDNIRDWTDYKIQITALLFQDSMFKKALLHKVLIKDIENQQSAVNDLINGNNFYYFTLSENRPLVACILDRCNQEEFTRFCSYIGKGDTALIKYMQQSCSKFTLPPEVIALVGGKSKAIPKETNKNAITSAIEVKKEKNATEILLALPRNASDYIERFEAYVKETYRDQAPNSWDSLVVENYEKIFKDLTKRYRNKEIDLTEFKDERILELAFKYEQEMVAKALGLIRKTPATEMVWFAVKYNNRSLLKELLQDTSQIDFSKKDQHGYNLLHVAAWKELETIKLLIETLPSQSKQWINEPNNEGSTPVHFITERDREFDGMVKMFFELGGDFKLKNNAGAWPAQGSDNGNLSSARKELYKKIGVTNLKTLEKAIHDNDIPAVKEILATLLPDQQRAIFEKSNIKVPVHKPLSGSMLHSLYRSYFYSAIYHSCEMDMIRFLIEAILMKHFDLNNRIEILKESLEYTNEIIVSGKCNTSQHRTIKAYLEGVIEKLQLANKEVLPSLSYPGTLFSDAPAASGQTATSLINGKKC